MMTPPSSNNATGDTREECLSGVVADAALHGVTRIVLERDDSIEKFDRKILYREFGIRSEQCQEHDHLRPHHRQRGTSSVGTVGSESAARVSARGQWRGSVSGASGPRDEAPDRGQGDR